MKSNKHEHVHDDKVGGEDKTKPEGNPNLVPPKKVKPPRPKTIPIYNGKKPDVAEF